MTRRVGSAERSVWVGAVAVLATSLAWLVTLQVAWLAHAALARSPHALAVARALGHIVWSAPGAGSLAVILALALGVLAILLRALAGRVAAREEVEHA
jgi:hypothetical protein